MSGFVIAAICIIAAIFLAAVWLIASVSSATNRIAE